MWGKHKILMYSFPNKKNLVLVTRKRNKQAVVSIMHFPHSFSQTHLHAGKLQTHVEMYVSLIAVPQQINVIPKCSDMTLDEIA